MGKCCSLLKNGTAFIRFKVHQSNASASDRVHVKGFKKVPAAIKLCSYYFSHYVSNDINVTGIL